MIAQPNSSPETMLRAVSYTIAALDAAAELDLDLTAEEQAAFAAEKSQLVPLLDKLLSEQRALDSFLLKQSVRLQARVILGDSTLDRGVRDAKALLRVKLPIGSKDPDFVFGANLRDVIDVELRKEPFAVEDCLGRLEFVQNFEEKNEMKKSLETRISNQIKALTERDAGEAERAMLSVALTRTTADCSDALYRLEKRLLDRFPRERTYVRGFFLETASKPKLKKAVPVEQSS